MRLWRLPNLTADSNDPKLAANSKEPKLTTELKDPKLTKDSKDPKLTTESKDSKLTKDSKDPKLTKDPGRKAFQVHLTKIVRAGSRSVCQNFVATRPKRNAGHEASAMKKASR